MNTPFILYVDDDKDDCNLLKESFAETTNTYFICVVNGEEAIEFLNSELEELPSLIILDLNMPKRDGRQTLMYIKSQTHLAHIPVVMLSTSDNQMDKEVCKRLGASSYLQKPYRFEGYKKIVESCMPLIRKQTEAGAF